FARQDLFVAAHNADARAHSPYSEKKHNQTETALTRAPCRTRTPPQSEADADPLARPSPRAPVPAPPEGRAASEVAPILGRGWCGVWLRLAADQGLVASAGSRVCLKLPRLIQQPTRPPKAASFTRHHIGTTSFRVYIAPMVDVVALRPFVPTSDL